MGFETLVQAKALHSVYFMCSRCAVAIGDVMGDLLALRQKALDDELRIWRANPVGEFVSVKASVEGSG